jgi:hypothetical protein
VRILFDQGVPLPLRRSFSGHEVITACQGGWSELSNGELLSAADAEGIDLFVTTDQNLGYRQDLRARSFAVLVLMVANWPALRPHEAAIAATGLSSFGALSVKTSSDSRKHALESGIR